MYRLNNLTYLPIYGTIFHPPPFHISFQFQPLDYKGEWFLVFKPKSQDAQNIFFIK
jgi:hypothetical protein